MRRLCLSAACSSTAVVLGIVGLLASGCTTSNNDASDNEAEPVTAQTNSQDLSETTDGTSLGSSQTDQASSSTVDEGSPATSDVEIEDLIERNLIAYTEAINDRRAEDAFALFTEELQQRVPLEELADGTSTSYISRLNVSQVIFQTPDVDAGRLERAATVFASFRSDQDPAFARDGQTCSIWEMEYRVEQVDGRWLIDSATALGGTPFPCPIVAERESNELTNPTLPEQFPQDDGESGVGTKPVVHLTLDDGPGPETSRYLALFDEYGIEATFFVNSNKIPGREDVTNQIVESGHAIANHTHTHCNIKNPSKLTPVSQCGNRTAESEIGDAQDIISATTGITPKCFRPPFGAQSQATRAVVAAFGLANWLWDIDTNDWQFNAKNRNYTDSQAIAELNKASTLKPSGPSEGVVVLLHDGTASAPRMLKLLRSWLEQNSETYEFKKLTNC